MSNEEQYREILRRHLNDDAVEWVYSFFTRNNIFLHITRQRNSKLGDYSWPQRGRKYHKITVNGDLNPYMFMWVFLHEAAHFESYMKYDTRVQPHGHEWQAEYARLLRECVSFFPPEACDSIVLYASKIPLVRAVGRQVEDLLHRYDPGYTPEAVIHLDDLPAGSLFRIKRKPSILFRSDERRRTRWLCTDTATGRRYTVPAVAEVIPAD
ncbi:MAG: SprT-like domain-containing protein [Bacteroidales bacterium]|nr:SprT-like domain-containing protein [Bacteroidales bacterium]